METTVHFARRAPSATERLLARWAGEELATPDLDWFGLRRPSFGPWDEWIHPSPIETESKDGFWAAAAKFADREILMMGLIDKRVDALLDLPRYVEARDGRPESIEAAQFCRWALGQVDQLDQALRHVAYAAYDGLRVLENVWQPVDAWWVPTRLIDRPVRRFLWNRDGVLHLRRGGASEVAPAYKFAQIRFGSQDSPYGSGLFERLYWLAEIKRIVLKRWVLYLDRYADPALIGRYKRALLTGDQPSVFGGNQGTSDAEAQKMLKLLRRISAGDEVAIPEDMKIEAMNLLQATSQAAYGQFLQLMDRWASLMILGELDTSGLGEGPGSFAKSTVSNEVRLEKVGADARFLGAALARQILEPLVRLNLGPNVAVPRFVFDVVDASDREQRRNGIDAARQAKIPVPKRYALLTWQIPDLAEGEEALPDVAPPPAPAPPPPDPALADREAIRLAEARSEVLLAVQSRVEARSGALGALADEYTAAGLAHAAQMRAAAAEAFGEGGVAPGGVLAAMIDRVPLVAAADSLHAATIHAAGLALWFLQTDHEEIRFADAPDFSGVRTPAAALDFWGRLLALPRTLFDALVDPLRRLAFSLQAGYSGRMVISVHQLLGRAVGEGWGRAKFVEELDALFEKQGLTPNASHNSHLVYSNATRQVAGYTQWQRTVGDPTGRQLFPYLMWHNLEDERVRDRKLHNHEIVGGAVFAAGHSFFRVWWTPAGHECRCYIEPISRGEARRAGYTGEEPLGPWPIDPRTGARALPDPGFRGAPDPAALADDEIARLRTAADAAGGDELRAVLTTLARLFGIDLFGGSNL